MSTHGLDRGLDEGRRTFQKDKMLGTYTSSPGLCHLSIEISRTRLTKEQAKLYLTLPQRWAFLIITHPWRTFPAGWILAGRTPAYRRPASQASCRGDPVPPFCNFNCQVVNFKALLCHSAISILILSLRGDPSSVIL